MLIVTPEIIIPRGELTITYARSGGPGGQNVNKLNTKATLRWPAQSSTSLPEAVRVRLLAKIGGKLTNEGDLLIVSQRFREAGRNAADCLEKLRLLLLSVAKAPKKRRPTKATRGSIERRLQKKHRKSGKKRDRGKFEDE